ncbi:hypothetical protein E2562_036615 [Oryza meyeriana var. granulata]|uniref:Uncharacterized protein n=1 Tax=Oryza meyeriana var. granulata TaxID=110450 RepID=A0A6G1BQE4_9ORYZ|nr:hypothetical protein E2562_036615 [Oryza meyeriana var. granulata]
MSKPSGGGMGELGPSAATSQFPVAMLSLPSSLPSHSLILGANGIAFPTLSQHHSLSPTLRQCPIGSHTGADSTGP